MSASEKIRRRKRSPCRSMVWAMRPISVASRPRPMMFGMMSSMETNDVFAWVQAAGGAALVCRPLETTAHHLYTTRQWSLGTPTADGAEGDAAWDQVARAAGVDRDPLVRIRQGHGAAVVLGTARLPAPDR